MCPPPMIKIVPSSRHFWGNIFSDFLTGVGAPPPFLTPLATTLRALLEIPSRYRYILALGPLKVPPPSLIRQSIKRKFNVPMAKRKFLKIKISRRIRCWRSVLSWFSNMPPILAISEETYYRYFPVWAPPCDFSEVSSLGVIFGAEHKSDVIFLIWGIWTKILSTLPRKCQHFTNG